MLERSPGIDRPRDQAASAKSTTPRTPRSKALNSDNVGFKGPSPRHKTYMREDVNPVSHEQRSRKFFHVLSLPMAVFIVALPVVVSMAIAYYCFGARQR